MNFSVLLPLALMMIPIIPTLIEIFRRKDKGPRKIPEETIYEEKRQAKALLDLERLRAEARIKGPGDVIRIVGDINIPDETEIKEPIVVQGFLKIGKRCRLYGDIKSSREVEVGEESVIEGHILSDGKVTIGPKAIVKGIIDSTEDIILEEQAIVEAVSTEKTVEIGSNAKIKKEIRAGVPIPVMLPPARERLPEAPIMERLRKLSEEKETPISPMSSTFETFFQDRETRKLTRDEETRAELTETEDKVLRLTSSGRDIYDVGLALLLDPVEVQVVLRRLVEKKYLTEDLKPAHRETTVMKVEKLQRGAPSIRVKEEKKEEEPSIMEIFENLLALKMREEVKKKTSSKTDQNVISQEEKPQETATTNKDAPNSSEKELDDVETALKEWQNTSSLLFGKEKNKGSLKKEKSGGFNE